MKISLSNRELALAIVVAGLLTSCGDEKVSTSQTPLSRTPVSVRGWIAGIAQSTSEQPQPEMAVAQQHYELIAATNISVEGAPYASGGLAENGSFLILDAPDGRIVISFIVPGQPEARLVLENIPGNADVIIPGLILKGASVEIRDPTKLLVRIPSKERTRKAVSSQATIGGHPAPAFEVPIPEMRDRRDYPQPDQGTQAAGDRSLARCKSRRRDAQSASLEFGHFWLRRAAKPRKRRHLCSPTREGGVHVASIDSESRGSGGIDLPKHKQASSTRPRTHEPAMPPLRGSSTFASNASPPSRVGLKRCRRYRG